MSIFARTATGDLAMPLAVVTDPVACAAQRIADDLNLFLGEWAFNTLEGFPWLTVLGVKGPNLVALRSKIRAVILAQAPVVVDVQDVSTSVNPATGALTLAFQASCNSGAIIRGSGTAPNIVAAVA